MDRTALHWVDVAARLAPSRIYWLGTTAPNGSPHATPVWGAVVDATLYVYTERSTAKAKNLARDPRAVLHLESGDDVVIVHGALEDVGDPSVAPEVVDALALKYDRPEDQRYLPSSDDDFDVLYRFHPRRALLWRSDDFEGSQRRWAGATA